MFVVSRLIQFLEMMLRKLFKISKKKKKKSVGGKISTQILKGDFSFDTLANFINKSIKIGCFPDSLKEENITPIFYKSDPVDKSNYRPFSILPNVDLGSAGSGTENICGGLV